MAWGTGGKEEGQGHRWTRTWVDQDRNTHTQGHRRTGTETQTDKIGTQTDENRGTNRHGKGYGMDMDYFYR